MVANSTQVGGTHYNKYGLQPWDALEKWLSHDEFVGLLRGEAIAYQVRYKDKGGVEDLKKAIHVLTKLIEVESKTSSTGGCDSILGHPNYLRPQSAPKEGGKHG